MSFAIENQLIQILHASNCFELEIIQELWSGYGKISRYKLSGSKYETVVVKCIDLKASNDHPRGWNTPLSHRRKVKSYEVETYWYQHYSEACADECKIPSFLGSFQEDSKQWIVLEDLDHQYPERKQHLVLNEIKICVQWLAYFHATFLGKEAQGLWEIGSYWHLDTRPDEYAKMEESALKESAHLLDKKLNNCRFKTLVHGDAKVANFCFNKTGDQVAAVDFQYVGSGCGMKDLAYLLSSCLSSEECFLYEDLILDFYFQCLNKAFQQQKLTIDFDALENEWRSLYPLAYADFVRFLLGWMPSHQKVNPYSLEQVKKALASMK